MSLKVAAKIARAKSRHKIHRHAALLMNGSRILLAGFNHEETHAEVDAIQKIKWVTHSQDGASGLDLLSIRVTRGNKLGCSKPCSDCRDYIVRSGIRRIIYTDKHGLLITEKL
jgi:tRNA(Arg) A34 adenosine deaminase TadA